MSKSKFYLPLLLAVFLMAAVAVVEIYAQSTPAKPSFVISKVESQVVLYTLYRGDYSKIGPAGGEDHTLVLTQNKWPWGCDHNGWYQLGIGNNQDQKTLDRVHGTDDFGYLEDINDIAAGWMHSLALDVNRFV